MARLPEPRKPVVFEDECARLGQLREESRQICGVAAVVIDTARDLLRETRERVAMRKDARQAARSDSAP
jgi:hypothetical protein